MELVDDSRFVSKVQMQHLYNTNITINNIWEPYAFYTFYMCLAWNLIVHQKWGLFVNPFVPLVFFNTLLKYYKWRFQEA